jgi:hypothetical protein
MNRFQLDVARMDRRHRLMVRTATFVAAAAIMALALWSAGLSPGEWLARARDWIAGPATAPVAQVAPSATPALPSAAPATPTEKRILPGTDSSVSTKPMPLILVAALPGRNAQEGTAQIGTNPENPQTFVAGAILANGARLVEIHPDHVVLERKGKRARLYAKKSSSDELTIIGGPPPPTPKLVLTHDALTDVIRPTAQYENDLLVGLQVFPGQQSGNFARLGLKAGDVIVAIEGAPIADEQAATDQLRTLTEGAPLSVRIRRGHELIPLSLDGSLVASSNTRSDSSNQPQMLAGPPTH